MKEYGFGLFFKNEEERVRAINILSENGIEAEHNTCYIASIKEEIAVQLENNGYEVTEELMNKCMSYAENYDLWNNLEEAVEEIIDRI